MDGGKLRKCGIKREISMFEQFNKYKKMNLLLVTPYIQKLFFSLLNQNTCPVYNS